MIILLLGGSGQLGQALLPQLLQLGKVVAPTRQQLDLTELATVREYLVQHQPQLIVNAAAFTAVDFAESERATCTALNQQLPACLAQFAATNNIPLLHFSTDYVYDGHSDVPYTETAKAVPLQHYGQTKLAADQLISQSGCRHLIFRCSWLYSAKAPNFVLTMLQLGRTQTLLQVVDDQIGAPTAVPVLAVAVVQCLKLWLAMSPTQAQAAQGIYHIAAAGACSWYQFATEIFRQAAELKLIAADVAVQPINSLQLAKPAQRPANSRLSQLKLQQQFGMQLPDWQKQLTEFLPTLSR